MYNVLYKVGAGSCTSTERYRRDSMKISGLFIGALGVCVVVALVVGLAGAAVVTPHIFGKAARNESAPGQGHGTPEGLIAHLEQQGVDVSAAKTAFANGDMAALKTWLEEYRDANPRNQTGNQERPDPAKIIAHLEQQGVDVSAAKTAFANGDMAALKTWLEEYRDANPRNQTGNQERPDPAKIIAHLEQQGVDVSAAKTAIANGDTAALKTWLEEYRDANPRNKTGNRERPDPAKVIAHLEQQGVDVSDAKTAIANGDTTALKTWLETLRASHTGEIRGTRWGGLPG